MRQNVKEFIESTIDLIEQKEYHQLFTTWYLNYYNKDGLNKDYEDLQELFSIFDKVDIYLYKDSEEVRKDIIAEYMYDYIDDVLANDLNTSEITLPAVIHSLNSKLSISLLDLNQLFKHVASIMSGRYDITILPFKIQRNS